MAEIEIDGKKVQAEPGSMIIEAADQSGIWIPRFCYHKKLSIAANCRMCLVEVEKAPKPLPACATPITEGMKIRTRSEKALNAQKSVMEFLLINHPLDCPICDQGGECELQDISLGFGQDYSRYEEGKRVVKDKNIGPLIATDMTRCIQCTRCVRFGTEVAGMRELGATGRGEHMEIGTFVERNVDSEVSGNVIDLCPVGALTSKPYRFTARGWELKQGKSIAPHDGVGSHIFVHSRQGKVMRVVPKENEEINEVWLSDRDRFSYEALSEERLETPQIKLNGVWRTSTWAECLEYTANALKECASNFGADSLSALASPSLTTEEYYILQKLMRGLGSHHLDHRLRQRDFRYQAEMPLYPNLGDSLQGIESRSLVLLVGSDLRNEQPLLNLKLIKMKQADSKIAAINPLEVEFNFDLDQKIIADAGNLPFALLGTAKALVEKMGNSISSSIKGGEKWLEKITPTEEHVEMAEFLSNEKNPLILLGSFALMHEESSHLLAGANLIAHLMNGSVGILAEGGNAAGAWIAGCLPHRLPGGIKVSTPGLNSNEFVKDPKVKAALLLGIEPDVDCIQGKAMIEALKNMPLVVAFSAFESESLKKIAHVLLPMAAFTETAGTFINMEGRWQSFKALVPPTGESRPLWKILRVLGNLCELPGFHFNTEEEVLAELKECCDLHIFEKTPAMPWEWVCPKGNVEGEKESAKKTKNGFTWLGAVPLYGVDMLVRRAPALQQTSQMQVVLRLHSKEAQTLQIKSKQKVKVISSEGSVTLPVEVDDRIPMRTVYIPMNAETKDLGSPNIIVEIMPLDYRNPSHAQEPKT